MEKETKIKQIKDHGIAILQAETSDKIVFTFEHEGKLKDVLTLQEEQAKQLSDLLNQFLDA